MTAQRCIPIEEIGRAIELHETDPRPAHLRECPRCRALADQFRAFAEASPHGVDDSNLATAESALRAAFERELATSIRRERETEKGPWWEALFFPAWKPALALAVVASTAFLWSGLGERAGEPLLRGGTTSPRIAILAADRNEGGVDLRWQPSGEADGYEVRIYSEQLEEIARIKTAGASLRLLPAHLPASMRGANALLIRIVALKGGDQIAASGVQAIERP